jgi:phosphatidylcholine synthase
LTATGAALALLALLAAAAGDWTGMFLWLLAALAVDGIDGPLARSAHVRTHAPRIDGVLLDLIIDYLTYVFIPLFALTASGLLPGWPGLLTALGVAFASALYFARDGMKTADKSFSGFPACWNMVALVAFVLLPPPGLLLGVVAGLAVAMFLPLHFVHPVRTRRWRALTLPVACGWAVLALWAAFGGLVLPGPAKIAFGVASLWLLGAGAAQQLMAARAR